jgi:hypothetical protein
MKINFDSPILGQDDKPTDLKLGEACAQALLADAPDERANSASKAQRFDVWLKIKAGGEVDLKAEEIALIKERIGTVGTTLLVGRAFALLDA